MKQKISQFIMRQAFTPSMIGVFINPFFITRRKLYKAVQENISFLKGTMLDFGCGQKPYKSIIEVDRYVGMDIEESGHDHSNEDIDVYYDGKTIPFEDNYFDSVFTTEVFEHVFNLDEMLQEISRVMKPKAHLVLTVPFVWDEHEIPYDFGRYTSFGMRHLLEKHGFEVVVSRKTSNYVETITQLWNAFLYQHVFPKHPYVRLILTACILAPTALLGLLLSKILPRNTNLYLDNVMVAQKK